MERGLVRGQGRAKRKGRKPRAPKRARKNAPAGLGSHVEAPNGEDRCPSRGAGLPHASVGGKNKPKVGLLGLKGAQGNRVGRLECPKPGPDSRAPTAGPLKTPPSKGKVGGACNMAPSAGYKHAYKGVEPGGPGPPQGAYGPN